MTQQTQPTNTSSLPSRSDFMAQILPNYPGYDSDRLSEVFSELDAIVAVVPHFHTRAMNAIQDGRIDGMNFYGEEETRTAWIYMHISPIWGKPQADELNEYVLETIGFDPHKFGPMEALTATMQSEQTQEQRWQLKLLLEVLQYHQEETLKEKK